MAGLTLRRIGFLVGYDVDKQSEQKVENSVKSLKEMASTALKTAGVAAAITAAVKIGKACLSAVSDCVSLSSEVEEMENKFNVVFSHIADDVDAWAQDYADAIGRNKNDIKTYLADQQNLLVGFGMTREAGAELSKQMTTLALDLASFGNLDETSAVNNMTKAVMGESEAAKALGAVLNDTTREQAMLALGLSGTYESLDQLTKMQVNYQAILSQSPDAIGDCERSLNSYASTMKQFQAKLKEVKTLVGQFFMPVFQKVISFGSRGLTVLRDGVQRINDFAKKVGGAEKLLKVFGVALGATLILLYGPKLVAAIKGIKGLGTALKALGASGAKIMAVFAVILLLVLLIEDFISFMKGEDSLIGSLFEKAGIDADKARQTILNAWETIKGFLLQVWDFIKGAAQQVFGALSAWWAENGAEVMASFQKIWNGIKTLCVTLWNALKGAAQTIFNALKQFWDQWGSTIISVFSTIWNTLISLIQPLLDAFAAIIDFLANVFTGNWQGAWQAIKDFAAAIWEALVNIINGAWTIITTVWGAIVDFFSGIFQNVWDAIVEKVTGIKDSIVNGFQAAIDWITSLPEQALQWGKDIIQGIIDGITSMIDSVVSTVSNVASTIADFLGFSVPEEGPLSDFDTYMPDMIDLMTQGIAAGKEKVKEAVSGLAENMSIPVKATADDDIGLAEKLTRGIAAGKEKVKELLSGFSGEMSVMANSAVVSPGTVATASGSGGSSKTVTQNININNQFNGDRAGQEKSSKAMDKASDDATSRMARALAYAR